jgi:hypothetical protein
MAPMLPMMKAVDSFMVLGVNCVNCSMGGRGIAAPYCATMPGGRTVPAMRGRCGRVIHRTDRTLPSSLPLPGWGTTGSATHRRCKGSGNELRFSFGWFVCGFSLQGRMPQRQGTSDTSHIVTARRSACALVICRPADRAAPPTHRVRVRQVRGRIRRVIVSVRLVCFILVGQRGILCPLLCHLGVWHQGDGAAGINRQQSSIQSSDAIISIGVEFGIPVAQVEHLRAP